MNEMIIDLMMEQTAEEEMEMAGLEVDYQNPYYRPVRKTVEVDEEPLPF